MDYLIEVIGHKQAGDHENHDEFKFSEVFIH